MEKLQNTNVISVKATIRTKRTTGTYKARTQSIYIVLKGT